MTVWVPFERIVATSHRVDKYGGVAFAETALQQMVDALNDGKLPMLGHHDWTKRIRTKDVEAQLVTLDDGEHAVRVTCLVDQRDLDAIGPAFGMSFTTTEDIGRAEGPHPERQALRIAADAGWFDDDTIANACSIMCAVAPVDGARLLQFSAIDDARFFLEISADTVAVMGPAIAANAVWEGIKYLLVNRRKRDGLGDGPTRIELRTDLESGEVIGIIDTAAPEVAQSALATYAKAVETAAQARTTAKTVIEWRPKGDDGTWVPLTGQDE